MFCFLFDISGIDSWNFVLRLHYFGEIDPYYYYYYGRTNVWMPRVKTKSSGWAANCNQPQHRLKFVVKICKKYILYIYIYIYQIK